MIDMQEEEEVLFQKYQMDILFRELIMFSLQALIYTLKILGQE